MTRRRSRKRGSTGQPPSRSAVPSTKASTRMPAAKRRSGVLAVAGCIAIAAIAVTAQFTQTSTKPSPATAAPANAASAGYVGAVACASCHAKDVAAWKGSDHDLAMQVADEKSVLGNFGDAKFTYAGTTSTFSRRDGKFVVNTDGPDGKVADYEIKYTFG